MSSMSLSRSRGWPWVLLVLVEIVEIVEEESLAEFMLEIGADVTDELGLVKIRRIGSVRERESLLREVGMDMGGSLVLSFFTGVDCVCSQCQYMVVLMSCVFRHIKMPRF